MKKHYVVDTNVLEVANCNSQQADIDCFEACIEFLTEIRETGIIIIDTDWEIMNEYNAHACRSGQPGVGDSFFKWLHNNCGYEDRCLSVKLSLHNQRGYREFPDDPVLEGFDRSDRKFVAVAIASCVNPDVVDAVDTDFWIYKESLNKYINLNFPCPELIELIAKGKAHD